MFKANEYVKDIFSYGLRLTDVSLKTGIGPFNLLSMHKGQHVPLTNDQELKLIRLFATCIHEKNKREGKI